MRRNSEFFTVNYQGINLEFEFFNIDYIFNQLTKLKKAGKFQSVDKIKLPNRGKARVIRETCSEKITENDSFTYIKFFTCNGVSYGLVGGKTNYRYPDVSFDLLSGKNDNRIARHFLNSNEKYSWADEIIVINHKCSEQGENDRLQAIFVEKYVQRMFNLLDS